MCRWHANTTPFCVKSERSWVLESARVLEPIPCRYQRTPPPTLWCYSQYPTLVVTASPRKISRSASPPEKSLTWIIFHLPSNNLGRESRLVMSDSLQPHGPLSVHGILQARILDWVAMPSHLPDSGIKPGSPTLHAVLASFTIWVTRELTTSEGMVNCYLECQMRKHGLMCWITCWRARVLVNWWAWTKKIQVCPMKMSLPRVLPRQEILPELCVPHTCCSDHVGPSRPQVLPECSHWERLPEKESLHLVLLDAWHRARLTQGRGEGTDNTGQLGTLASYWRMWEEQTQRRGHWSLWLYHYGHTHWLTLGSWMSSV